MERTGAPDLLRSRSEMLGTSLFMPSTMPASYQPVTTSCGSRTVVGSTPRLQLMVRATSSRRTERARFISLSYDTGTLAKFRMIQDVLLARLKPGPTTALSQQQYR